MAKTQKKQIDELTETNRKHEQVIQSQTAALQSKVGLQSFSSSNSTIANIIIGYLHIQLIVTPTLFTTKDRLIKLIRQMNESTYLHTNSKSFD